MERVVVVGQRYAGLPVAVRAAEVGCQALGFDGGEARVDCLWRGRSRVEDLTAEPEL